MEEEFTKKKEEGHGEMVGKSRLQIYINPNLNAILALGFCFAELPTQSVRSSALSNLASLLPPTKSHV